MNELKVLIVNDSDLPLPAYESAGAAGFDIRAAVESPVVIEPRQRAILPTGLHISLPQGHDLQIRGRSGLAAKHGIVVAQGVGTIDSDYRGEIHVILMNHSDEPFTVNRGDRIAQGVVTRYERVDWQQVDSLDETARGDGKFGSTGRN